MKHVIEKIIEFIYNILSKTVYELNYIDLDFGWTLNNHLQHQLFCNDYIHLNRKGCKKFKKLFISKIESLQKTL